MRTAIAALALVGALIMVPAGQGLPVANDPVVNGEFELDIPLVDPLLEGSPLDECIGVGHQVFWGTDSPQHDAERAAQAAAEGDAAGTQENASKAADHVDSPSDAQENATFQSGYGYCVFGDDTGYDIAWLNPALLASDDAVHWSGHDDDNVTDVDGDGDLELQIPKGSGHHNLWQAWPSPHQAYTANFDALTFRVEEGAVPSSSAVVVSLSAVPLEAQNGRLVLYLDCQLRFDGDQLVPDAGGVVSVDPLDARFTARHDSCKDLEATWDNSTTTDDERREVLGRTRIVQLSFWGFERVPAGSPDVVIDGVGLPGATLFAEEAAHGNVNA